MEQTGPIPQKTSPLAPWRRSGASRRTSGWRSSIGTHDSDRLSKLTLNPSAENILRISRFFPSACARTRGIMQGAGARMHATAQRRNKPKYDSQFRHGPRRACHLVTPPACAHPVRCISARIRAGVRWEQQRSIGEHNNDLLHLALHNRVGMELRSSSPCGACADDALAHGSAKRFRVGHSRVEVRALAFDQGQVSLGHC